MPSPEAIPSSETSEAFYSGALRSDLAIPCWSWQLVLSIAGWWRYGWRVALGFACGCTIAYLNFFWLKRVVTALADRATEPGQSQSSSGVVLRFLLRYVLMALGAYVIFTVSPASLYGLFAGLFLPAAAIACEAAYEGWMALARGV